MTLDILALADLRGLRTAPALTPPQRHHLQVELRQRLAACEWCTIGVMAPGSGPAHAALVSFQQALGWPPFAAPSPSEELAGSVFLKGHQRTGRLWMRAETGLGEGVLITGHNDTNPEVEDTWGPFPLDFFAIDSSTATEPGAAGL